MAGFERGEVRTDRVVLREPRPGDEDGLAEAALDPLTQRFSPGFTSRADVEWYVRERAPQLWTLGDAVFAVAEPGDDRPAGIAVVREVGWASDQVGKVGYFLAPRSRGRGLATAAVRALTGWAFSHGVARLELRTQPENVASQRVALAAGYRREGVLRGVGAAGDGSRVDDLLFARLSDDPPGPTPRALPDLPGGELADGVVTLRPLGPDDADETYRMRCLPDVVRTWVPPRAPERTEVDRACRTAASHWLAGTRADLVVCEAGTGAYAGQIDLHYTDPSIGAAMIGYATLPAYRGRGFATRATTLLARWAFEHARLARLYAGTRTDNAGSQRVLERAGFRREGVERGLLPGPDGERVDSVLFGLLRDDPSPGHAETSP